MRLAHLCTSFIAVLFSDHAAGGCLSHDFSVAKGKANKQLATQHRINAHVVWSRYQEKRSR